MNDLSIRPGDIFCSNFPNSLLGRAILFFQRFNDIDDEARYSHAGILLDGDGTTFEALLTVKRQNLFEAYRGQNVIIGRHLRMDEETFRRCLSAVLPFEGRWYPVWRLPLHIVPPLAKYASSGKFLVCSELVFRFVSAMGREKTGVRFYRGVTPDYIADAIRRWDEFEIVYEGALP